MIKNSCEMNDDAEKIDKLSETLAAKDADLNQAIGLAMLLKDGEDRDLYLLHVTRALLERGDGRKAHGVTELMGETYESVEAIIDVAEYLGSIDQIERSLIVFAEAEAVLASTELMEWQHAELLNKLANLLFRINAKDRSDEVRQRAIDIAREGQSSIDPQDAGDADKVLAEIVVDIAKEQRINDALRVAESISNEYRRERVLSEIRSISSSIKEVP